MSPTPGKPIQQQNVQYGLRHDFGTTRLFIRCQECGMTLLLAVNPSSKDQDAAVADHLCPVELLASGT